MRNLSGQPGEQVDLHGAIELQLEASLHGLVLRHGQTTAVAPSVTWRPATLTGEKHQSRNAGSRVSQVNRDGTGESTSLRASIMNPILP